jgi:hypothetical protein
MKQNGIKLSGFRLDKNGQLVRCQKHVDVSARLRQKASKRVRVAKGYNRP